MATLTRPKSAPKVATVPLLSSVVPTPFPKEQLAQDISLHQPSAHTNQVDAAQELVVPAVAIESPRVCVEESESTASTSTSTVLNELMPSIAYLQKSCLMTLNNLLAVPTGWNPIVPDRRHSMPSSPQESSTSHIGAELSSSSALLTLVSNLRTRNSSEGMIEAHASPSESELIHELRNRVERISPILEPLDAQLSVSLVSLLAHFNRLSIILASSQPPVDSAIDPEHWTPNESETQPLNLFDTLKRQLSDLQLERLSSQPEALAPGVPPVVAVETALLWSKIDEELETVVSMCKERTEDLSRFLPSEHLPPQYDPEDYDYDTPPEYESGARTSLGDSKSRTTHAHHSPISAGAQTNEKMRLDLEAVAMAIDRLYLVAPQLHNQRVELKSSKLAQMERARRKGSNQSSKVSTPGKQKHREANDLENLLDLLGKATDRSLKNQSVILDGNVQTRLENARLRDMAKRDAFVQQLAEHSDAGRFHGQDAVLQPRIKDPEALLTLPEFIREAIPPEALRIDDPRALLTLPEFVKGTHPQQHHEETPTEDAPAHKSKKSRRDRSLSAPSLSWLRSSSSRSLGFGNSSSSLHSRPKSRPSISPAMGFDVSYVAEHHENLQHVLVFMSITGATLGVDIEAEVLPPFPEPHSGGGDRLLIKSGAQTSLPLCLPARTPPGKREVKIQSGHYEIKLSTVLPEAAVASTSEAFLIPLLDASQLASSNPTSFICASCSLPLVHGTRIDTYKDLPSDHWEELIDAWMCHADQKLHDHVAQHGRGGFWPLPGQALVGGSYILFEDSSIVNHNLCLADRNKKGEDWRLVRCLCGAVIGRSQDHRRAAEPDITAYRLLKYAIRPVSQNSDPIKIPLSAFIVEDMIEFVQAHATYRFVILDEEDERPRMLVWLFKPSMRLAYTTPSPTSIPKSGSVHAAKVLYKILTPSDATPDLKSLLNKYPGFPQAEYLYYPMSICRRVTRMLKESTAAYPESMRMMTGLDVGWLQRA